jgi:addiction module RelE/StbE family toxin
MVRLSWTKQAVDDLREISEYISKDSRRYAVLLIDRIKIKARMLKSQPESGRIVKEFQRPDIREILEGNYRIIYRKVNSTQIHILTVHHSARKLSSKNIKSVL